MIKNDKGVSYMYIRQPQTRVSAEPIPFLLCYDLQYIIMN